MAPGGRPCGSSLVDTVYGDLYLQCARNFIEPALSEAEFAALQLLENEASNLPNRIFVAMKEARWMEVKDLSARMSSLKRTLTEKEALRRLGEKIYKPGEPQLDPFSPGLQGLTGNRDPQALMQKLSTQLEQLHTADPDWHEFYAARKIAMTTIKTYASKASGETELTNRIPVLKLLLPRSSLPSALRIAEVSVGLASKKPSLTVGTRLYETLGWIPACFD